MSYFLGGSNDSITSHFFISNGPNTVLNHHKSFLVYLDFTKVKLKPKNHQKAAWLASNCHTHSEREQYVRELQKYFPVDVYGKCGSKKCPDKKKCHEYLAKNYMFYLSFENSICQGLSIF